MASPRLAVVLGEPGGIGGELCAHLAQDLNRAKLCTVFGSAEAIRIGAHALGVTVEIIDRSAVPTRKGQIRVLDFPAPFLSLGTADPRNADSVMAALHAAIDGCIISEFDGLVTGPLHKASIHAGGYDYTGTTEVLATRTERDVVMMLAREDLRVALVTTHLPLRQVPDAVTTESVERTLRITDAALRNEFGFSAPKIAVLGLNPHAGESGLLGAEEREVISPVIAKLMDEGLHLIGPLPADTAFLPEQLAQFDAVVAMYHDQGLPVLKSKGLDHAVNITLGLPFPRVAVDHGTALDIAGKGSASAESFLHAVDLCASFAKPRTDIP